MREPRGWHGAAPGGKTRSAPVTDQHCLVAARALQLEIILQRKAGAHDGARVEQDRLRVVSVTETWLADADEAQANHVRPA